MIAGQQGALPVAGSPRVNRIQHAISFTGRHNGEVPSTRPKSESEPVPPTKPKTLSGDWGDKSSDLGMNTFCLKLGQH